MLRILQKIVCASSITLSLIPNMSPKSSGYYNPYGFKGEGTIQNPFIIDSLDELVRIKKAVNEYSETFSGAYFKQTEDIDLSSITWDGIGDAYDNRLIFKGDYNGDGHVISNLVTKDDNRCNALFSLFGGKCYNLGIESGSIYGNAVGSFVSHSAGDGSGLLINCYNKATVYGNRSGGLADNFTGGHIYNCVNLGQVYGPVKGGITTIGSPTVMHSGSYNSLYADSDFYGVNENNFVLDESWSNRKIADKLNNTLESSCQMAGIDMSFMRYFDVNDDGELCFGELFNANKSKSSTIGKNIYWISFALGSIAVIGIPTSIFFIEKKRKKQ